MDMQAVGRRIKERREYLKLTQKDVADLINTSRSNYARYEAGDVDLSLTTLESLSKALTVPISYFVPSEDWSPDDGPTEAYFRGLPPETGDVVRAMLKAAHEEAQRKQKIHGRKAE